MRAVEERIKTIICWEIVQENCFHSPLQMFADPLNPPSGHKKGFIRVENKTFLFSFSFDFCLALSPLFWKFKTDIWRKHIKHKTGLSNEIAFIWEKVRPTNRDSCLLFSSLGYVFLFPFNSAFFLGNGSWPVFCFSSQKK